MRLDINFPKDVYTSTEKSIPVVVTLYSDEEVEIAEKIDLKEILLMQGKDAKVGTYTTCRLGLPRNTFIVSREKPHYIMYDVYENCTDMDIESGVYEVAIKLKVFLKVNQNNFQAIELDGKKTITIE